MVVSRLGSYVEEDKLLYSTRSCSFFSLRRPASAVPMSFVMLNHRESTAHERVSSSRMSHNHDFDSNWSRVAMSSPSPIGVGNDNDLRAGNPMRPTIHAITMMMYRLQQECKGCKVCYDNSQVHRQAALSSCSVSQG